jgi:TRAP-type C4-dicarboxylate transport system substrate-binding protein
MLKLRTLCSAFALAAALGYPAIAGASEIKLKAVGQPVATGSIQKDVEQPFFEKLGELTGLPVSVDYKPVDTLGIKDTEELRVLKAGLFDIVSLRVLRNSRDEPSLLGLDLVGASPDHATGRKIMEAYSGTLGDTLQKKFNAKLLGGWAFGPQMMFCRKPIDGLASLKGMKVRVIDQNLAIFVESLGGTPVPMSLPDTHQALSLGVVDCAVSGANSANAAGWPEVTTHQLPIGVQMSAVIYAMNMKAWQRFTPEQQAKLQQAFTTLSDDMWKHTEKLHHDALACNAGEESCAYGKKYALTTVPVSDADIALVRDALVKTSLPAWAEVCDRVNPGCTGEWKKIVGPVLGLELK